MQQGKEGKPTDVTLSLAAPHISKNKGKIEYVVRRQSSIEATDTASQHHKDIDDNASQLSSGLGYPISPRTVNGMSSGGGASPFAETSRGAVSNDEMRKLTNLLQDHQKSVNGQVDECRTFVMQSMDRIMDVLEQRVLDINKRNAQAQAQNSPEASSAIVANSAI